MKNVRKWDLDSFRNGCVRDYQLAPYGRIISRINHPMETLLHIIDGLDEFTRNVSIQDTFVSVADTKIFHKINLPRTEDRQILSSAGILTKNWDLYFKKQITNENKLKACWYLMERQDEIKQHSFILVNASLFAALLKGKDSASFNTLTQLYYELSLYLMRSKLSRLGIALTHIRSPFRDTSSPIQVRVLATETNAPLIMG